MNRSNASQSNSMPVTGPALKGVKQTSAQSVNAAQPSSRDAAALKKKTNSEVVPSPSPKAESVDGHRADRHDRHHEHGEHGHVHDDETIRRIVNRLSRIEGHVRGLKRMVQDQENCPDVLIQVAAVRGALDKVARLILDEHLTQCILRAAEQGNIEAEIEELQAALNRFLP